MHREVHAAEASGFVGFFDAVNGELRAENLLCSATERAGRLHEHTARTARGVEYVPMIGFKDFDDQVDDAGGV